MQGNLTRLHLLNDQLDLDPTDGMFFRIEVFESLPIGLKSLADRQVYDFLDAQWLVSRYGWFFPDGPFFPTRSLTLTNIDPWLEISPETKDR